MCGLVGMFDLRGQRPIDRGLLERMNQSLSHRGPDEDGLHVEPGVGLGHRRLSIIDLSSGQQPLYSADRKVVIVYNGEVYNFRELRRELEAGGARFATHSDTEVIVQGWLAWGEDVVKRLRGMFAFALYDARTRALFLARDRLGIKPLYYATASDGMLVFGSELKSLLLYPQLPREIAPRAVEDYFAFGYIPDPKTIFKHAHKLPPGHTALVRSGAAEVQTRQYWDVPFAPHAPMSEADAARELIERAQEAVRIRLVAEVPLGAFLSGGVDSSAVVAMMSGASPEPVKTCSISFGDPRYNESQFAEQVAKLYGTAHRVEQVESDDYGLIDRLAGLYDEPYADSSAMPTYRVCELARKDVTVALSGDGGDENLAGYRRYRWHMYEEGIRSRLPPWLRRGLFGSLGAVYPKADWAPKFLRAKTTLQSLGRSSVDAYLHSVSIVPDALRAQLFSERLNRDLGGYRAVEVMREHAANAPTDDALSLIQYLDFKTYLPGDILTKVDRASMAHSLEVRVPLLDHQLVEWISGLEPSLKLRGQEGKYVFKKGLESMLPRDILYRPKMGFSVPLSGWFRGAMKQRVRDALLGQRFADSGLFDPQVVRRIVDQHQRGTWDHTPLIWSLLMFDAFERNLDNATTA